MKEGLGIGLGLIRKLVALHGVTIESRSDGPGRGSTFEVRLPTLPSAPESPPIPRRAAEPSPGATAARRRILVVDDLRCAATSLAMLLTLAGHEVEVAHD